MKTLVTDLLKNSLATNAICPHPNKHAFPAGPPSLSLEESFQYGQSKAHLPLYLEGPASRKRY